MVTLTLVERTKSVVCWYPVLPDNEIYNMQDAGIAFMESMNGKIYNNEIRDCRMGIRLSMGSAGNEISENIFDNCADREITEYKLES